VLSYLRKRSLSDLRQLKTAAAVYATAIDHMLAESLAQTLPPGRKVNNDQVKGLATLLAVAAWEGLRMFQGDDCITLRPNSPLEPGRLWSYAGQPSRPEHDDVPKYEYNVGPEDDFENVKTRIKTRYQALQAYGDFDEQWLLLGQLNARFLDSGLFDDSREGLDRIVWSNRSIHEFCLARYFAAYALPGEEYRLWEWLYLSTQPVTDDYYQFWQFLCEMPPEQRSPSTWLRSISVLYGPSIPDAQSAWKNLLRSIKALFRRASADEKRSEQPLKRQHRDNPRGQYYAKRSNEMIYRSWDVLQAYAGSPIINVQNDARRILQIWQGEFEGLFLQGRFGKKPQQTAKQITEDFLVIEQQSFVMGTSDDKVIDPQSAEYYRQKFEEYRSDYSALQREHFDPLTSRAGQIQRELIEPRVKRALQGGDLTEFLLAFHIGNDRRYDLELPRPDQNAGTSHRFGCARRSVTNAWYRLYDCTWGFPERQDWYQQYSKTQQHPAIGLSFYDSWVLCQWLSWNGQPCRLLWEDEWEYCAKFGFQTGEPNQPEWDWDFWFGREYDPKQHRDLLNCRELGHGETMIADKSRASPASRALDRQRGEGLMDFQGNHWVWCQDAYREKYAGRQDSDAGVNAHVSRVVRGGSFHVAANNARCSRRLVYDPSYYYHLTGCRVARAEIRKP
jgi:formylglycine-generating enzyme required for sulfatase activity